MLFGNRKKKSSCCDVQFEEVKEEKKQKSGCCDVKIEEIKDEDKSKKSDDSCCSD